MTTGIWNTNNFTQDQAKKSFAALITRLMPNGNAPLFALTSMLNSATAAQVEHGFFTKTMIFPSITFTASAVAGDTTLTVASTANLLPGQIHQVFATKENIIINTVASATSITVTRGVGTVAAGNIANNGVAYQVGNAYEEASLRPQALAINPVRITNLTQIFRNSWAISGSAQATQVIAGGTQEAESKQDCAMFHAADIEKALWFGQKSQGIRNGQPFRTMDGLISIVSNIAYYPPSFSVPNVFPAGSTTTYTQLENMLDPVFNQNTDPRTGNERVLFVGGSARKAINHIGRLSGEYKIIDGQTNFGLAFSTVTISRGVFKMIEHPLFNSNPDWSKMAVAVDLPNIKLAYLGNRKTENREFNKDGKIANDQGIDAVGGTLTTELTMEVHNPPANSIITGLTAGAAE